MNKELGFNNVAKFYESFDSDPRNRVAMNAVTSSEADTVSLNRDALTRVDHTFSHIIKTGTATSQGQTGRCWIFAGLNTMRIEAMKRLNLKDFEFSQSYLMFWDKLEKANFFLENIIETRSEALDSRLVMWLLDNIVPDAGQWDMFVNLVKKYGVVPKNVMPETKSSFNSRQMNSRLTEKLREYAKDLRDLDDKGCSLDEMRERKEQALEEIYRILCIHLGRPPERFFWEWRDKDDVFHRHGDITPVEFFKHYVRFDLDSMVCLINAPTADKPFNRTFTVEYLGNVVGGQIVMYLNVDMATMKNTAMSMVRDGNPVWFGADAGKSSYRDLGVFDLDVYDHEAIYGTRFGLDKAGRLDYGHSRMTHAMVFIGIDIEDSGRPRKWKVENSYGLQVGDKGFYVMTDRWFEEYVYEVMIHKSYLSTQLLDALALEPVVLRPWDPMGALA